jgi:outer membrane protein assembly factor BamB
MTATDLIFVGIKGSVVALNRATGEQVWSTHLKGSSFVNVVVADGRLLATCSGEIFCLDPLTGDGLWHNRLKGFGIGLATIAAEGIAQDAQIAVLAEKRKRDDDAAAAAAAAA